jgi:hypothetical protein
MWNIYFLANKAIPDAIDGLAKSLGGFPIHLEPSESGGSDTRRMAFGVIRGAAAENIPSIGLKERQTTTETPPGHSAERATFWASPQ